MKSLLRKKNHYFLEVFRCCPVNWFILAQDQKFQFPPVHSESFLKVKNVFQFHGGQIVSRRFARNSRSGRRVGWGETRRVPKVSRRIPILLGVCRLGKRRWESKLHDKEKLVVEIQNLNWKTFLTCWLAAWTLGHKNSLVFFSRLDFVASIMS